MARALFFSLAAAAACLLAAAPRPAAALDCALPCSCAYGVAFGESLCNYANTTRDIKAFQDYLTGGTPDWEGATRIYLNGSFTTRGSGKRTLISVTTANYREEPWFLLATSYFGSQKYIDDIMGPALAGTGDYADACCGIRTETLKAASRWWSATYAIHEVDAGFCFATGCNNRTQDLALAGEEILHGMALISGAYSDSEPAGPAYNNPATLFKATNAAAKCRAGALAGINKQFIAKTRAAAEAAVGGDIPGMTDNINEILKTYVARFLQWSLQANAAASTAATGEQKRRADACHKPCIKRASQAAAHTYFKAVEPMIARDHPDLAAKVLAVFAKPSPYNTNRALAKHYNDIMKAYGLSTRLLAATCNPTNLP